MSVIKELIRTERDSSLSFGDYTLNEKTKKSDYENGGSLYKVKTFKDITRLEKDELFAYESVPGTAVFGFTTDQQTIQFKVEGLQDAQITIGAEPESTYEIFIDGQMTDEVKASLGGKVSFSVELEEGRDVEVKLVKQA